MTELDSDYERLRSLVDAGDWNLAEPLAARLLSVAPEMHELNAWMSRIKRQTAGLSDALPYARAALDCGIGTGDNCMAVADILYHGGDFVRATAASAVTLIVRGSSPRLTNSAMKSEAMQFLVRYITAGKSDGTIPNTLMDTVLCLALPRIGDFDGAYEATLKLGQQAFQWMLFDADCQVAWIDYRRGRVDEARSRLLRRVNEAEPAVPQAYLSLVEGSSSWAAATLVAKEAVDEANKTTSDDPRARPYARFIAASALAVCEFLNERPDAGTAALLSIKDVAFSGSVRQVAMLLGAVHGGDFYHGINFALALEQWDETGDYGMPFAQTAIGRLAELLRRPGRSLTEAQGLRHVRRLMSMSTQSAHAKDSLGGQDDWFAPDHQLVGGLEGTEYEWWATDEVSSPATSGRGSRLPTKADDLTRWWI
jgi:hypothetical protein